MSVALIAAVSTNGCIGKNNTLPWHLAEDMERFRRLTIGNVVLMGRKTWESIPEKFRPLPHRKNLVVSRQTNYSVPNDVELFSSIEEALEAHKNRMVFVIGGAEIYKKTIDQAEILYLTHVHQYVDGDAFFPLIDPTQWKEITREDDSRYSFVTYQRL